MSDDELIAISKEAYESAFSVWKDPKRREILQDRAERLMKSVAEHSKSGSAKEEFREMIGETLLDLSFILRDSPATSMRLGRLIRREQSKAK